MLARVPLFFEVFPLVSVEKCKKRLRNEDVNDTTSGRASKKYKLMKKSKLIKQRMRTRGLIARK